MNTKRFYEMTASMTDSSLLSDYQLCDMLGIKFSELAKQRAMWRMPEGSLEFGGRHTKIGDVKNSLALYHGGDK